MHCKYNLSQFDVDVNKYAFQSHEYVLPQLINLDDYLHYNESVLSKKTQKKLFFSNGEDELMEPFRIAAITTQPCKCTWEFMNDVDIGKIREMRKMSKLRQFIDKKLQRSKIKGLPRKLLIDLFISVIRFCFKNLLDNLQVCSLLAIFYNTHLYFSHNLWTSAEAIYKYFKDFLYFNCINLLPLRTKIFELNTCKPILLFFCNIYLRNLPLIRMLMLPNYGLYFRTPIVKDTLDSSERGKRKSVKKK